MKRKEKVFEILKKCHGGKENQDAPYNAFALIMEDHTPY